MDLWGTPIQRYYSILFGFYSRCIWGCVEEMNIINLHGDFCIHSTPDGFKYVEFNKRDTKIHSGETNASRQFKPKMWNTPNNISRCPLRIFEKFLQKRPVEMCKSESPFYLAVNYNYSNDDIWYKKQKMGKDRINTIMKRMAASAGLSREKNHSARKTMVTCLTKNSVPETQIIQLTGHKNLQSLNSYKKASLQQQKKMSHVLSSYKKPKTNPSSSYPMWACSEELKLCLACSQQQNSCHQNQGPL